MYFLYYLLFYIYICTYYGYYVVLYDFLYNYQCILLYIYYFTYIIAIFYCLSVVFMSTCIMLSIPHHVPPLGIYPSGSFLYAGPAISICESFAFHLKYERNAPPTDDHAFSDLDIFFRSAISVFRDFFILSVSGSSHTFSVAVWLYA
jgi:hypothetical protein